MIEEPDWKKGSIHSAVPVEVRALIGSIVNFQGSIEFELRGCISDLLKIDKDTVLILTSEQSYKQLMSLLSSLMIKELGTQNQLYKEFAFAAGKLDEFEAFRNKVAHSHWSHSLEDMSLQERAARHKSTSKRKQGLKVSVEEIGADQLTLEWRKAFFYLGELFSRVRKVAAGHSS